MNARLLFLAIAFGISGLQPVYSQLGFRLMNVEHMGKYGELFKPALVPEISYYSITQNKYILGIGVGFGLLQTRHDTFPHYALNISTTTTVYGGYEIYERAWLVPLTAYYARRLFTKPLSPILGLAVNVNFLSYNLRSRTGLSESYSVNEDLSSLGIMPFLGASYSLRNRVWLQLELGKQLAFDSRQSLNRQVRTSLSAIYFL